MLFLLFACSGSEGPVDTADDTAEPAEFCATVASDGGRYEVQDGGGNASSGLVSLRVLTNESDDPYDPQWVAFKDFTLQDVDSMGVPITGTTSGDGLVQQQVGAGTWLFTAAFSRGSTTCTAELELPVEAEKTTLGCPVMTCPD